VADNPLGPGTVLAGRFRLEDLLQETDGAKFWRATDLTLARSVAVNVVSADDARADALLIAARTSATVTDGHFLRVLDASVEGGVAYAVNEWGTGISLDQMLSEGPLPPRRAAWLVKEVAEAVSTAHAHGVAHGRLIPENVMVTEAGSVKLIGFVVAAVLMGSNARGADGEPLNEHEADVRNLAALLYATLVGRWPGSGGTVLPPAPTEHGQPLRPRQVRAGVPRPLDAICDRVLSAPTDPGVPIATAHEICAALSDYIGDPAAAPLGPESTSVLQREDAGSLFLGEDLTGHAPGGTEGSDATSDSGPSWAGAGGAFAGAAAGAGLRDDEPGAHRADEAAAPSAAETGASDVAGRDRTYREQAAAAETGQDAPQDSAAAGGTDPEATQAGAPVFDEGTGAGWASPEAQRRPAPPPPPPLPEPEPKPLFAPGPPRSETYGGYGQESWSEEAGSWTSSRTGPGSSHGTGSLPPVWGPDANTPDEPGSRRAPEDAGKSWLRLAAIVAACLILVVAVIIAFNLGRNASDSGGSAEPEPTSEPSQSEPSGPVQIASVDDFDPQGDPPEENSELTALAADGDPGTAWKTMTYYNNPRLGLLKDGVGLVVDLGSPTKVSQVQLSMRGRPNEVELLVPGGNGEPTSTDGMRSVAQAPNGGENITLTPGQPLTSRYLVVWLTSLPPASDGYQGQVAEIVVRR
jgi:hypothetical protein